MMDEFDHWDQVFAEIDKEINQLVRATAFKVEAGAKRQAPVDTGFLRNSIYVQTEKGGDYGQSAKGDEAFPEISTPAHNEALIAVGAHYGIYQEFGTTKMAAHPYLVPALEKQRHPFLTALKKAVKAD